MIGASLLVISYGYQVHNEGRDPLIDKVRSSLADYAQATLVGAFLVDTIPACKLRTASSDRPDGY